MLKVYSQVKCWFLNCKTLSTTLAACSHYICSFAFALQGISRRKAQATNENFSKHLCNLCNSPAQNIITCQRNTAAEVGATSIWRIQPLFTAYILTFLFSYVCIWNVRGISGTDNEKLPLIKTANIKYFK